MKFEAEIIKDIVDSRGHTKTSIHYQSECVEEWVKEVEGAYPKLCDYQPEWLNYSAENKIGVFPYTSLTDVTNATVENVVPYAYKSAILKGNTLVNLCTSKTSTNITPNTGLRVENIKSSTKYLIIFDYVVKNSESSIMIQSYMDRTWVENTYFTKGLGDKVKFMVKSNSESNAFRISNPSNSDVNITLDNIMVIEYQDGMENWDIPYFKGMASVKMPVLSTVGKNLASINNIENIQIGIGDVISRKIFDISLKPNTKYSIKTDAITSGLDKIRIRIYKNVGDVYTLIHDYLTKDGIVETFTTSNELVDYFVTAHSFDKNYTTVTGLQIEEGATISPYEPYKSNILTVNEDVTLRGIGNVKDELDLMTGELTQRIEEVVFDGSDDEGWNQFGNTAIQEKTCLFILHRGLPTVPDGSLKLLSDKYIIKQGYETLINTDEEMVHIYSDRAVYFRILKSKLSSPNVIGFKEWLSKNPFTVQYRSIESVKTVDLNVVDQDGNALKQIKPIEGTMQLNTSGETIKPLFSGEIPVEAITQNLASFIEG